MKKSIQVVPIVKENRGSFEKILFDPRPLAGEKYMAVGAVSGEEPCGTAVLSVMQGKVHIHSVYVVPEYRRRGIGKLLMDDITGYAKKKGCALITTNFMYSDEGMEEFLLSQDFFLTSEDAVYEIPVNDILNNGKPDLLLNPVFKAHCKDFGALDAAKEKEIALFLEELDFPAELLKAPDLDRHLSCCSFDKNGALQAIILCTSSPDRIMVELLVSRERIPKKLIGLLSFFYDILQNSQNSDRILCFQDKHENTVELVEKLLETDLEIADFPVYGVLAVE